MYPSTIPGKCIAGLCAITGVILIAMPISLLANNFAATYNFRSKKERILRVHNERKNFKTDNYSDLNGVNKNLSGDNKAKILFSNKNTHN